MNAEQPETGLVTDDRSATTRSRVLVAIAVVVAAILHPLLGALASIAVAVLAKSFGSKARIAYGVVGCVLVIVATLVVQPPW